MCGVTKSDRDSSAGLAGHKMETSMCSVTKESPCHMFWAFLFDMVGGLLIYSLSSGST